MAQEHPRAPVIAEGLATFQIGGSERLAADLAYEFVRRGYRVICFAFYDSDGPIRRELEAAGIHCFDMNYLGRPKLARQIRYQLDLRRLFRRESVRALHVHHATTLILSGVAARLARLDRILMTEHSILLLQQDAQYRRWAMWSCRLAHEITAVAPEQLDYLRVTLRVPVAKLHHVPNGVKLRQWPAAERAAARQRLGVPPGCFAFLFAGRLHRSKDLRTLLHAVAGLNPGLLGRIRLYIAGDGPERGPLVEECAALNLDRAVHFLGVRADVAELMSGVDAFVMSSVTEGLPMALLEAMAVGLPCIATRVGGIPGVLSDGAGVLVDPSDVDGLRDALARVASDADWRARLAASALERVRRSHSLDDVADRYLALFGLPSVWHAPGRDADDRVAPGFDYNRP